VWGELILDWKKKKKKVMWHPLIGGCKTGGITPGPY
jgi:hypothetical protein